MKNISTSLLLYLGYWSNQKYFQSKISYSCDMGLCNYNFFAEMKEPSLGHNFITGVACYCCHRAVTLIH